MTRLLGGGDRGGGFAGNGGRGSWLVGWLVYFISASQNKIVHASNTSSSNHLLTHSTIL